MPDVVVADAGYGSEENYQAMEEKQVTAYVKHNQFDRQQNGNIQSKKPFATDKLFYNKENDCYYCPMGQQMKKTGTKTRKPTSGFTQTLTQYTAQKLWGLSAQRHVSSR
ncbi:MAG: hypothetical protein H7320_20705 [Ferruginibacter sp.]|nr:hypothetical protein [Ferruginibacter sp.]